MNCHDEDDIETIIDLGNLLSILLAQPDAETALDGMRRVAYKIVDCAKSIRDRALPDEGLAND